MQNLIITYIVALFFRLFLFYKEKKNRVRFGQKDTIRTAVEITGQDQRLFGLSRGWYWLRGIYFVVAMYVFLEIILETVGYEWMFAGAVILFLVVVDIIARNKQYMYDWKVLSGVVVLILPCIWLTYTLIFSVEFIQYLISFVVHDADALFAAISAPSTVGVVLVTIAALCFLCVVLFEIWWMFEYTRPYALYRFEIDFNEKGLVLRKQFGNNAIASIDFTRPYRSEMGYIFERVYIGGRMSWFVKRKAYIFEQDKVYLGVIVHSDSRFPGSDVPHYTKLDLYKESTHGFIVSAYDRRHFLKLDERMKQMVAKVFKK